MQVRSPESHVIAKKDIGYERTAKFLRTSYVLSSSIVQEQSGVRAK